MEPIRIKNGIKLRLLSFFLFVISGLFLAILINQPFGFYFLLSLSFFTLFLCLFLVLLMFYLFNSQSKIKKVLAVFPLFLGLITVFLFVVLLVDFNMLYFKSKSPKPSAEGWIKDIRLFKDKLIEKHPDIEDLISIEKLNAEFEIIENKLPDLNEAEKYMELFKFISLPQDAHTFPFIMFPGYNLHSYPFQIFEFKDGFYVTKASREHKSIEGYRLIAIGNKSITEISKNYPLFLSSESEYGRKMRFNYMALITEWLYYHGIIDNMNNAEFTFENKNGEKIIKSLPTVKFYPHFLWTSVFPIKNELSLVYTNPRKKYYQFEVLENSSLYIEFNQCENQSKKNSFEVFQKSVINYIENNKVDRLILDVRKNDGESPVWTGFLDYLVNSEEFNQKGKLFLLVGRRTFSSAVMLSAQLQLLTDVYIIGEPTAQGPTFYSGPNIYKLPNTKLHVSISSRLRQASLAFDRREAIVPDSIVTYSFNDFENNFDPALNVALTVQQSSNQEPVYKFRNSMEQYAGRYVLDSLLAIDIHADNYMTISITDYIPGSYQRFRSVLYPLDYDLFETKLDEMKVEFLSDQNHDYLTIIFGKDTMQSIKVDDDYVLAMELLENNNYTEAIHFISQSKNFYLEKVSGLETILNGLGYNLMNQDSLTVALELFELNTELFPKSYNVYDSYAEALLKNMEKEKAIQYYKKSLEINPNSKSGQRALHELGVKFENISD